MQFEGQGDDDTPGIPSRANEMKILAIDFGMQHHGGGNVGEVPNLPYVLRVKRNRFALTILF